MIQNIWRIVLCLSLLFVISATAQDKSTEAEVDEVLARVQSRSGQKVEWLVDLGQPAVPAICQRLKTYSHPMVIVNALAKLRDPRATEPLIELLDTLKPLYSDANYTASCIMVINALKEIGDLRAEKRLVDIMAGELAYMRVRLYAAGALARFGSPSVKEQARTFIMSAYVERSKYIRSSLDHDFLYQDIYVALCEVGTDEALDIVLNVLRADAMPYQKMAILKYLPKREDEKIVATLLEVSANKADEVHIRLKALDILMTFESKVSIADLRTRLDKLNQCNIVHEAPEYKRQFNALIDQLSRREQEKEPVGQIEGLLSQDSRIRDQVVDSILQDRQAIVNKLIPLIDPANAKKYSDQTRCAAAYLLGEFRASEAVPILSRALADEPGAKIISRISRYDVPVWTALVKIGRPTVPAMIENIETSDNRILRKKSLDVLNHVLGGKRRLLELLSKLQKKATDKEKHRRITVAQQFAEVHFKEDKEPLY